MKIRIALISAAFATTATLGLVGCSSATDTKAGTTSAAASAISSASSAASSAAASAVATADLKTLVSGRTFSGESQGAPYDEYYTSDGKIKGQTGGSKYTGSWQLTGDQLCFTYESPAQAADNGCYTASVDGNKVTWFKDGKLSSVATYVEGNPKNL